MNYYISDLHLNHDNIIKLSNRPFKDINEMNDILINNINKKVKETDNLYILGDVSFVKRGESIDDVINLLNKIKCKNLYLIVGNHDNQCLNDKKFCKLFKLIKMYDIIYDEGQKIVLFHYPIEEWACFYKSTIHLHGHVHNNDKNLIKIKNRYNVSCDVLDYEPKTLKELISK